MRNVPSESKCNSSATCGACVNLESASSGKRSSQTGTNRGVRKYIRISEYDNATASIGACRASTRSGHTATSSGIGAPGRTTDNPTSGSRNSASGNG
jgi:hypothetical protein